MVLKLEIEELEQRIAPSVTVDVAPIDVVLLETALL